MTEKLTFWQATKNVLSKIKGFLGYFWKEYVKFPGYIITHPFKGFDEFKRDKRGKMSVALFYIIVMMIIRVLEFQNTGFVVAMYDVQNLNTFAEISYILVPVVVLVLSNWSITTLFDGKGKMKEIFMLIGYSMAPLAWTRLIGLFTSNIVTADEVAIHSLILNIGVVLMCYMAFCGFISVHEFGLFKCLITLVFTAVAALVIMFVCLLCFDLFQKVYGFVYTIYREISLRYL